MMHHPLREDQIVEKFLSLTSPLLGESRANNIAEMVLDVMNLDDAEAIARELVVPESTAPDYSALRPAEGQ